MSGSTTDSKSRKYSPAFPKIEKGLLRHKTEAELYEAFVPEYGSVTSSMSPAKRMGILAIATVIHQAIFSVLTEHFFHNKENEGIVYALLFSVCYWTQNVTSGYVLYEVNCKMGSYMYQIIPSSLVMKAVMLFILPIQTLYCVQLYGGILPWGCQSLVTDDDVYFALTIVVVGLVGVLGSYSGVPCKKIKLAYRDVGIIVGMSVVHQVFIRGYLLENFYSNRRWARNNLGLPNIVTDFLVVALITTIVNPLVFKIIALISFGSFPKQGCKVRMGVRVRAYHDRSLGQVFTFAFSSRFQMSRVFLFFVNLLPLFVFVTKDCFYTVFHFVVRADPVWYILSLRHSKGRGCLPYPGSSTNNNVVVICDDGTNTAYSQLKDLSQSRKMLQRVFVDWIPQSLRVLYAGVITHPFGDAVTY